MIVLATLSPDHDFPGTLVFQAKLGVRHPVADIRQQCTVSSHVDRRPPSEVNVRACSSSVPKSTQRLVTAPRVVATSRFCSGDEPGAVA